MLRKYKIQRRSGDNNSASWGNSGDKAGGTTKEPEQSRGAMLFDNDDGGRG